MLLCPHFIVIQIVFLPALSSVRAEARCSNARMQEEAAVANGRTADTEVDNDDDAILLLKALAAQDPEVRRCKLNLPQMTRRFAFVAMCVSHCVHHKCFFA